MIRLLDAAGVVCTVRALSWWGAALPEELAEAAEVVATATAALRATVLRPAASRDRCLRPEGWGCAVLELIDTVLFSLQPSVSGAAQRWLASRRTDGTVGSRALISWSGQGSPGMENRACAKVAAGMRISCLISCKGDSEDEFVLCQPLLGGAC